MFEEEQTWVPVLAPLLQIANLLNISVIILDMGALLVKKKKSPFGLVGINEDRVHACG